MQILKTGMELILHYSLSSLFKIIYNDYTAFLLPFSGLFLFL